MLTYKTEPLTPELEKELMALAEGYWQEVAGPFHAFPPDIWWISYRVLQDKGWLKIITARDEKGELMGGAFSVICPHQHYACIMASIPLLYLHPSHRKGREGVRLVKMIEKVSTEAGAQLIMTHGGMHNNVYRLFEGMDYRDFGRYFIKVSEEGPHGLKPIYKENK